MNYTFSISDEKMNLFKRSVRRLLEATFIVDEKEPKLYSYISKESNRLDVSDYLNMIGFDVMVDSSNGVAMLTVNGEDAETVGLKRANIISFTTVQYHMLLCLWEIYLENVGYQEKIFVERGDLIDKIRSFIPDISSHELKGALRLFKKYSFIDFDDENDEEAQIRLYPTLQFGWDIGQFRTVASEYIDNKTIGDADMAETDLSDEVSEQEEENDPS